MAEPTPREKPDKFRDTSRVGPCLICGRATVSEHVSCAGFVCVSCHDEHQAACGYSRSQ